MAPHGGLLVAQAGGHRSRVPEHPWAENERETGRPAPADNRSNKEQGSGSGGGIFAEEVVCIVRSVDDHTSFMTEGSGTKSRTNSYEGLFWDCGYNAQWAMHDVARGEGAAPLRDAGQQVKGRNDGIRREDIVRFDGDADLRAENGEHIVELDNKVFEIKGETTDRHYNAQVSDRCRRAYSTLRGGRTPRIKRWASSATGRRRPTRTAVHKCWRASATRPAACARSLGACRASTPSASATPTVAETQRN